MLSIDPVYDYAFYDPGQEDLVEQARADQYWAVYNVPEATCHLVYMYETLDSEDFSYFYVHDVERGVNNDDSRWYAFNGRGMLLYID